MSHFLDRLLFFKRPKESFSDGHGVKTFENREWENAYRNRWSHDKIVRSTHGVSRVVVRVVRHIVGIYTVRIALNIL